MLRIFTEPGHEWDGPGETFEGHDWDTSRPPTPGASGGHRLSLLEPKAESEARGETKAADPRLSEQEHYH